MKKRLCVCGCEKEIIRLYEADNPITKISKITGCSTSTAYNMLKKNNVKIKTSKYFLTGKKNPKQSATLKRLYREGKLKSWNKGLKGVMKSWCNGLTKEMDERIRKSGIKQSKTKKILFKEGKLKAWNKGNGEFLSPETRERVRQSNLGKSAWNKGLQSELQPNFGRRCSEKTKRKIGEGNKGKFVSLKTKKKISKSKTGKKVHSEENKKIFAERMIVNNPMKRPEVREKHRIACKKDTHRQNLSKALKGKPKSEETKKKHKINWQNPQFRNRQIRLMAEGRKAKPNKFENNVNNLIQTNFPNQYKINVSRKTIINGHTPDFINCNGEKKVILANGIYWHLWKLQKDNPKLTKENIERKERKPYGELGFKVLFVWEDEMDNPDKVVEKIRKL